MRLVAASELPDTLPLTPDTIVWLCEDVPAGRLAETALAPAEMSVYANLRSDKRRHDWLLGRYVAKSLIGRVVQAMGQVIAPDGIIILPHPDGWPQVSLPSLAPNAPVLTLTISHARDRAFCAVAAGAAVPLGVDLEAIEPRSPGFVADYFTGAERDFLAAAPHASQATLANAIWSGKEAALKAIRRGLAEDTRLVTCLPEAEAGPEGWRPLVYRWEQPERALPPLIGWWQLAAPFVFTVAATGGKGGIPADFPDF